MAGAADELGRLVNDFNTMAATLAAQRAELAKTHQLAAWNEMARQVAHEIKNPLTPMQLAAEHLQRVHEDQGRPLGAVFDQCVKTVLDEIRLLRQIASEFANFAGSQTARPAAVALGPLLEEIAGPYRASDRVAVVVEVPPHLPPAWADRTLLARALTNLVENGVQAMPGGGTVTITAASEARWLVIRLADTGVGMDETTAKRAFEPYFSTKTGGSGLGLANAKRNIELQGGTIDLVSRPGAGTTVTVRLPEAPASRDGSAREP
jgi:signal transduction histidine kinase